MADKPLISFDYAIKYLLKDKGGYEVVEGFISALLKSQGYKDVKIIALLDAESNKEDTLNKRSLADLIVEDEEHHKYIVEIERNIQQAFVHKACFNTSRLIVDHIAEGTDFTKIVKVFHISILYFPVGSEPIHHGQTNIRGIESKEKLTVHLRNPDTDAVIDATDILPEYFFISVPLFNDRLEKEIPISATLRGQDPAFALNLFREDLQSLRNQVVHRREFILKELARELNSK